MGRVIGRIARLSVFGAMLLLGLPQPVSAQATCEFSTEGAPISALTTTRFVPNGGTAQVLVRWLKPANITIYEVDPKNFANQLTPSVAFPATSIRPPGDIFEPQGFSDADSSLVSFTVPERDGWWWKKRAFVIRLCGQEGKPEQQAWAVVTPRVSSPCGAIAISVGVIFLLYVAFASAVRGMRDADHPLQVKWPAYAPPRQFGWLAYLDPVVLTASAFNKGSIQKLQVLVFTFLVGGMVLTLVLTAGFLPNFSTTVALLLGISAVGAAVAHKTATSNERLSFENWSWLVKRGVLPITRQKEDSPKWSDLVMNGREFDIYKLQTLLFSGVVAVALLVNGGNALETFTVPETLLGILGLSQIVYITGTLTRPPSVSDLDKAIGELRELSEKVTTALAYNVDTDAEGKLPSPLPPSPPPASPPPTLAQRAPNMNVLKQYNKKADDVEIMLESTLEINVERPKLNYA